MHFHSHDSWITRYHNQIEAVGIYLLVFIIFGIIWQQKRAISINCCIYCYQVNNKTVEKTSIIRNWFVRLMLSSRFSVPISISTGYKKCKHWKWFTTFISSVQLTRSTLNFFLQLYTVYQLMNLLQNVRTKRFNSRISVLFASLCRLFSLVSFYQTNKKVIEIH